MCAWLALMIAVLKAKLPPFEIVPASCVFDFNVHVDSDLIAVFRLELRCQLDAPAVFGRMFSGLAHMMSCRPMLSHTRRPPDAD